MALATYAHLWPTAEDRPRQAAGEKLSEIRGLADPVRTTCTRGRDDSANAAAYTLKRNSTTSPSRIT